MAHLVSVLVFGLLAVGGLTMVAAMLAAEAARMRAILSGRELAAARLHMPAVKVRTRRWSRAEARTALPRLRAAAA